MSLLEDSAMKSSKPKTSSKKPVSKAGSDQAIVEATAKLTAKNQTTIPTPVRAALGLSPMDKIKFHVLSDGRVELTKDSNQTEEFDPMVLAYLDFIEADIIANPQILTVLQRDEELAKLLKDVELDENYS
jgi:antitoxin PrlF